MGQNLGASIVKVKSFTLALTLKYLRPLSSNELTAYGPRVHLKAPRALHFRRAERRATAAAASRAARGAYCQQL